MPNTEPLIHFPERQSSNVPAESGKDTGFPRNLISIEEQPAELLELRTDTGVVYVRPSRWERLRLSWEFRHFRVLPLALLSQHDQHLIERLLRTARVTLDRPVAKNAVFGVIEKVHWPQALLPDRNAAKKIGSAPVPKAGNSAVRDVDLSNPERRFVERLSSIGYLSDAKSSQAIPVREVPPIQRPVIPLATNPGKSRRRKAALQQWGTLGMLAAVLCVTILLARFYSLRPFPHNPAVHSARVENAAIIHSANADTIAALPARVSPPAISVPGIVKPGHRVESSLPETTLSPQRSSLPMAARAATFPPGQAKMPIEPRKSLSPPAEMPQSTEAGGLTDAIAEPPALAPVAAVSTADAPERLFISDLPQSNFVHPVVSDPNLVGELNLRALIGSDGMVKDVTVLSGNPKLAEAGIRAVRQWRYKPYQSPGHAVEMETQIRMNFFGQDTVSITSVPNNPAAIRK